jgi:glycosidase
MHWTAGAGAGFTTGTPWREPQADWATKNVAAQEADPGSLLNLHRKLVHLRKTNTALALGELVPLRTSNDQVAAYLRRTEGHYALVVANLGGTAVSGVTLASDGGVLPEGAYTLDDLLTEAAAAELHIGSDGRVTGYVPFPTLAPRSFYVLDLTAIGC